MCHGPRLSIFEPTQKRIPFFYPTLLSFNFTNKCARQNICIKATLVACRCFLKIIQAAVEVGCIVRAIQVKRWRSINIKTLRFPILRALGHYSPFDLCVFHGKTNTEALTASFNTSVGWAGLLFIPDAERAKIDYNYKHVKFNGAAIKSVGMLFLSFLVALVMFC